MSDDSEPDSTLSASLSGVLDDLHLDSPQPRLAAAASGLLAGATGGDGRVSTPLHSVGKAPLQTTTPDGRRTPLLPYDALFIIILRASAVSGRESRPALTRGGRRDRCDDTDRV
jgi:hypothetical protein